jgi:hypothetical protein
MAKHEPFRVGIIVSSNGLHSLGVTHGDWDQGCDFLQSARPLIADFVNRFQSSYETWRSAKSVISGEDLRK